MGVCQPEGIGIKIFEHITVFWHTVGVGTTDGELVREGSVDGIRIPAASTMAVALHVGIGEKT